MKRASLNSIKTSLVTVQGYTHSKQLYYPNSCHSPLTASILYSVTPTPFLVYKDTFSATFSARSLGQWTHSLPSHPQWKLTCATRHSTSCTIINWYHGNRSSGALQLSSSLPVPNTLLVNILLNHSINFEERLFLQCPDFQELYPI